MTRISPVTATTAAPKTPPKNKAKEEKEQPSLRARITREHLQRLGSEPANAHDAFNKKHTVDHLNVDIQGTSARKMDLTEALFGHKDTDYKFINRALAYLESLPPKERPDVVVVSGLIFGIFQHREKNNRRVKTMSIDEQFTKAKEFIDRLQKMGLTVVYNKSDNDQKIIEDYTYDAVKILEGIARKDGKDWPTSYSAFDTVKQSRLWQRTYEFQWDVVFEYMLRSGRRLHTTEEVAKIIEGDDKLRAMRKTRPWDVYPTEEYLLLLDAHRRLESGKKLTPLQHKVLDCKNIPHSKRKQDKLIVTDDYKLSLKTRKKETEVRGVHTARHSPTSKVKDPTRELRDMVSQMDATGIKTPDTWNIENEQHSVGMFIGKTLITSSPGLTRFNPDSSSYARTVADDAERFGRSRRELNLPGVQQIEFHDDGRITVQLMNDTLMNLAAKTNERHAAIYFSDWQTGSVTSRPDLTVKALDYALHDVLMKQPGILFLNGDIYQGRNYPEMPNENAHMGLVTIDDQQEFIYQVLKATLEKMPRRAKNNLQGVFITPGNHEWNSGHKLFGSTHSGQLRALFDLTSEHLYPTTLHTNSILTAGNSHLKSHTAITDMASHRFLTQHIMMERGAKGSGSLPINQFAELLNSVGPLMKELNIMGAGHYHDPSFMMRNDKIGLINGSMAGLSGYEWWRGYNPLIGTAIVHVGGNKPPEIEFLTPEFLYGYKAKGAFSEENLRGQGFEMDNSYNPHKHGFGKILVANGERHKRMPQSAEQKWLWNLVDQIQWGGASGKAISVLHS